MLEDRKINIKNLLQQGIDILKLNKACVTPELDAELILSNLLNISREKLFIILDFNINNLDLNKNIDFLAKIARRNKGEPVAYIINKKNFWSLNLYVDHNVLIPRPETELIIEKLLSIYNNYYKNYTRKNITILELGTGSGAIALALAAERPDFKITAVDISDAALNIAKYNQKLLKKNSNIKNKINFLQSNWFENIKNIDKNNKFDFIVSNPPYLTLSEWQNCAPELKCEPKLALESGVNGLDSLAKIITQAPDYLNLSGWLIVEHGATQADAVQQLFKKNNLQFIATQHDLADYPRITFGQKL